MATVTGLTAARTLEIEANSVVSAAFDGSGHLILTKGDATTADVGPYSSASTTAKGIVELATSAETTTGTDATLAVTPAGLAVVTAALSGTDATKQPLDSDLTAIAAISPSNDDVIQRKAGAWTNRTMAQIKTDLALNYTDLTVAAGAIAQSKVTNLTTDLAALAPLASPTFTGTVTATRVIQTPVALTDASTIAVNAALGNQFTVTLGGNRTLGNPTNSTNGQMILFAIRQDGTGTRTLTLGTDYRLGTDITVVTLSTAINKTDYLGVRYNSTDSKWDVIAFTKGF